MIRTSLLAAVLVTAGGGAFAQTGSDTWQFRCPTAGTIVEQSTGAALRYRAAVVQGVCNVGGQQRLLGYWSMREGFFEAGGSRIAAALTGGVDLARQPGIAFDYFGPNRYNISIHMMERWRAEPGGSLTTPAGTFETVKVVRDFDVVGVTFRYTQTVWFDRATNVPVQARVEHLNPTQAPSLVNWVATDIQRSQATAAR